MSHSPGIHVIANQLVKSATSVGANLEEAKAASSRREFARFVDISLREAREAHYWLRIIAHGKLASQAALTPLLIEADQLIRILTAIVVNTKSRGLDS
jgi:four helix bundle protein